MTTPPVTSPDADEAGATLAVLPLIVAPTALMVLTFPPQPTAAEALAALHACRRRVAGVEGCTVQTPQLATQKDLLLILQTLADFGLYDEIRIQDLGSITAPALVEALADWSPSRQAALLARGADLVVALTPEERAAWRAARPALYHALLALVLRGVACYRRA